MRDEHLQRDDDSSEREVQCDDGRQSGSAEPLDARVPRPLGRQSDEADAERKPDVGRFLDDPERPEQQDTDRCGSRGEDWQLARSERLELGSIESMTTFDAFAESVGVDVREPDHAGGRRNNADQLAWPEVRERARAREAIASTVP